MIMLCVLGDLNGWVGDMMKVGITEQFVVLGENDNGRKLIEFCVEKGLWLVNTYFKYKSLHSSPGCLEAKMEWR